MNISAGRSSGRVRALVSTRAPSSLNSRTVAAPAPRVPDVISARLPDRSTNGIMLQYLRRFPQVSIDLVTEGRLVDVVANGFDFGIRSRDLVPNDMIAVPVSSARSNAVVAAPKYLEVHGMPQVPTDLLRHACIRARLPNGAPYRWHFERDGEALQIEVAGPLTLDEPTLVRMAVLEGAAVGYVMEAEVREDIAAGRLIRLAADWPPPLAPLCLYYPGRRNASAAARALVELARERSTTAL